MTNNPSVRVAGTMETIQWYEKAGLCIVGQTTDRIPHFPLFIYPFRSVYIYHLFSLFFPLDAFCTSLTDMFQSVGIPVLTFPSFSLSLPWSEERIVHIAEWAVDFGAKTAPFDGSFVLCTRADSTKGFTFSSFPFLRQLISDAGYFTHVVIICADFSKSRRIRLKASEVIQGILFALFIKNIEVCMSG